MVGGGHEPRWASGLRLAVHALPHVEIHAALHFLVPLVLLAQPSLQAASRRLAAEIGPTAEPLSSMDRYRWHRATYLMMAMHH